MSVLNAGIVASSHLLDETVGTILASSFRMYGLTEPTLKDNTIALAEVTSYGVFGRNAANTIKASRVSMYAVWKYAYEAFTNLVYRSAGVHNILNSGTTIEVAYPVYPKAPELGDLLLMTIMARSTVTLPVGWTLVGTYGTGAGGSGSGSIHLFEKVSDGTETGSITVTQATSNRFLGQIINLRTSLAKTFTVSLIASGMSTATGGSVDTGTVSAAEDNTILLSLFTSNQASGTTTITVTDSFTLVSPVAVTNNRLGIAYKAVSAGYSTAALIWTTSATSSADFGWANFRITSA